MLKYTSFPAGWKKVAVMKTKKKEIKTILNEYC
jgi:hypothetical protein